MFIIMRVDTIFVFGGTNNTVIGGLTNVKILVKMLARHILIQTKVAHMKENPVNGISLVLIKLSMVTFLIQVMFNAQ